MIPVHDKRLAVEKKLLELMKIQQIIIEDLYKDVHKQLDAHTTKSEEKKVIRSVSELKMGINASRQKLIVHIKAQVRAYEKLLDEKYAPKL